MRWLLAPLCVLVVGCQGGHSPSACNLSTDCATDEACICPDGGRSCSNAVCMQRCSLTPSNGNGCLPDEVCGQAAVACCEGVSGACTLDCAVVGVCKAPTPIAGQ